MNIKIEDYFSKQEINDFNRRCAKFLGYTLRENDCYNGDGKLVAKLSFLQTTDLKFHSDWNWIMEVVEAIEKTNRLNDKEYYPYCVTIWKNGCTISDGNNGYKIIHVFSNSKKEAVVQAINQFLIWYNNENSNTNR